MLLDVVIWGGNEELYACEYCRDEFMEWAYNNLMCDICAIKHEYLD